MDKKTDNQNEETLKDAPTGQSLGDNKELELIEKKLEEAQVKAEENLRGWQRAAADFENYKRRSEDNNARLVAYGQDQVILSFLAVVEDLERVLINLPEAQEFETWKKGAEGVRNNFQEILKSLEVEKIKTVGEKFNPEYHEAVDRVPGGEKEIVAQELASGYKRGSRLLKPAQVRVYDGTSE